MSKRALLLVVGLLLCASCQKFAEGRQLFDQFHDFMALRDQIAAQFNEKQVYVNYSTGAIVSVQFINSSLLSASAEEKHKRDDERISEVRESSCRSHSPSSRSSDSRAALAIDRHADGLDRRCRFVARARRLVALESLVQRAASSSRRV